jgi:Ser/Thr protein kinase RdoA (MazF antagonist)
MSSSLWGNDQTEHFYSLTPDHILNSVEELGFKVTGRIMQLNSMENRVYEVEIELDQESDNPSDHFVIVKFYRPGRWSAEQIGEEHEFLLDLQEAEIPVIAPKVIKDKTIFKCELGLYYTLFPKKGGRAADEWTDPLLEQMGRLLARLHNVGASKKAQHRLTLNIENYAEKNLEFLMSKNILPGEYAGSYQALVEQIAQISKPLFNNITFQRVHGDCHHGNTLLSQTGPFLIDFDDMVIAPCVQDIWMVIPGRDEYAIRQRNILLDSYSTMRDFNYAELKLIEPLRALRMINFTSWIAHRWDDESFKRAFPQFNSIQYWEKELFDLRQQISLIQDSLAPMY